MTRAQHKPVLGVIGGSGVYDLEGVKTWHRRAVTTPFGDPSDLIAEGVLDGTKLFFLPRHGRNHRLLPSEINYQANIFALKTLGVTHLVSVSAVGIMREGIQPGDMVLPDQIFDRTKGFRRSTFFGDGIVGHVALADPYSLVLRELIRDSCQSLGITAHFGGTYVCIEGPAFSTRAESEYYRRTLNPAVIGMTGVPEAQLAREAEISYATLALGTDYDCWHTNEDDVSVEAVLEVLKQNSAKANRIISAVAQSLAPHHFDCPAQNAVARAIVTAPAAIEASGRRHALETLLGRSLLS